MADELRAAGHHVAFAASRGRRDDEVLARAGYESHLFAIGGLPRRPGLAQLRAIVRALGATVRCFAIVRRVRPDVVVAGGGFVAAPVAVAARLLRVPVVATEADAHLGLANRIAGRVARRLCTAYPVPQLRLRQEVTGRPVAPEFRALAEGGEGARATARGQLGLPGDARVLAIVGGSGGATRMNEAAQAAWRDDADPRAGGEPIWIVHVSGRRDFADCSARPAASERYRLVEYCTDMPALLAAADLVVSRPGGGVFELAAARRAAVLVPSPNVTNDHQAKNARHFVAHDAALLVTDAQLDGDRLRALAEQLLSPAGDARRAELAARIGELARPWAAARIATIAASCGAARARRRGAAPGAAAA